MRRSGFVLFLTTILISACTGKMTMTETESVMGVVSISLESRDGHQTVAPMSKSTVDVPEAASFEVEIFNSNKVRLYRDTYANTVGKEIPLNAGEYRLLAHYGDSLGVGFDKVYFEADQNFTVTGQTTTPVEATAMMANVMAKVNFGANFQTYYPTHYALLKRTGLSTSLRFEADETRAGFIPAGELTLEIYAEVDGSWKYYKVPAETYNRNEFVTFNVDVDPRVGNIKVNITIDDTVDQVDKNITVPADAAPVPAPEITLSGFDTSNKFQFIEGVDYTAQANFVAMGEIASCILNITAAGVTLPTKVDLINADAETIAQFEEVGITWNSGMSGSRFGSLNFAGLSQKLAYDPSNSFSATFSVTVTDAKGKETTSPTCTIEQIPASFTLNAVETNAFARRIEGVTANLTNGNPTLYELQYSTDQSSWTAATVSSSSSTALSFNTISGLNPSTTYYLRLIYNGNENNAETLSLTTEAAAQIGNSGFEDWYEWEYRVYDGLFSDTYHTNYAPYLQNGTKYWDSNNALTTPTDRMASGLTFKSFPMVTYVTGRTGSRAAQVMTIAISNTATSGTAPSPTVSSGRLFTGVYNSTEEISFTSRPSKLGFWYKFAPYDSDPFKVYVYLKNGSTTIAEGTLQSSDSKSGWTYGEIGLTYSRTDLKAQTVHVEIVSGVNAKWQYNMSISYGGTNTANVHGGSVLTIDDLELIYE